MPGAVAYLGAQLALRADDFNVKLKTAQKEAKAFSKTWGGVGELAGKVGAGLVASGGATVAVLAAMSQSAATMGEELHRASIQTGVSTDILQGLGFAVESTGLELWDLVDALKESGVKARDAAQGSENLAGIFADLGVKTTDINGAMRPLEDLLLDVADGLSKMEDNALAAVYADELFSDAGIRLLPILKQGREGIEAMAARGLDLSHVFSQDLAASTVAYMRAQQDATTSVGGFKDAVGSALIPTLTDLTNKTVPLIVGLKNWAAENPKLVASIAKVALVLLGAGGLLLGLSAVIAIAPAVGTAITFMSGPLGIAVTVVGALVAGFILFGDQIKAVGLGLLSKFTSLLGTFVAAARKVADVLGFDGMAGSLGDLEKTLKDTGKEWENTAADMWEGKETADDADAALVNVTDTLATQSIALAETKDDWDRLAGMMATITRNEAYELEQAIANNGDALINLDSAVINSDATLGGLAHAMSRVREVTDVTTAALVAPNASLLAALDTLGVKSTEMKNAELADLEKALREIERAVEDGYTDVATLEAAQKAYADALAGSSGAIEKTNEWHGALEQVSTIVTDFGSDLAEVILKGGTFKEVMTGAFQSVATVILRLAGEQVMGLLIKNIGKLIGMIPGLSGLGSALGGFFGGGGAGAAGQAAGAAVGIGTGVAGAAAGVGAGVASGAAGAGGMASLGMMGAMGPVGVGMMGAQVAMGAIQGIQTRRTNKLLGMIEESTRYVKIQTVDVVQKDINKYWPFMEHMNTSLFTTSDNIKHAVHETGAATVNAIGRVVTAIKEQKTKVQMTTVNQYSFADEPNEKLFDLTRNERRVMA